MVGGGSGNDVALACDLASEAGDGACDLVDLGEQDDAGKTAVTRRIAQCWSFVLFCSEKANIRTPGDIEERSGGRGICAWGSRRH